MIERFPSRAPLVPAELLAAIYSPSAKTNSA